MAKSPSTLRPNEAAYEAWAEMLIKRWADKINSLGITDSGALLQSFRQTVKWEHHSVDGEKVEFVRRILFEFEYYGKMVDYGLGRGTDPQDRFEGGRDENSNPRKRKEWIVEPFIAMRKLLPERIKQDAARYAKALLKRKFMEVNSVEFKTRE